MELLLGLNPTHEFTHLEIKESVPVFLETNDNIIGECFISYDDISMMGELKLKQRIDIKLHMNYLLNPISEYSCSLIGVLITIKNVNNNSLMINRTLLR